ncbi:hypothetical protein ANOM_001313 [Aspergillus nomiae NRRL 13137]|uniref:FAD-binding PCMH-type domain-containing protein n=1 Tax=Aspergillus nomiae NRRL (strain ATCC 15546 / NRRL 13137 / CBS 260.88 / M93) TaxID=1509407 RepID=A0A0L1JFW8_ASPN3|nr:uncharacterized protein ANOM_001313 [Aspergillus nomiae NRRL 13137]KNG90646.1 hypothetical protein ANOM_001313 [Aspergillus nomiae NRRL 13137]
MASTDVYKALKEKKVLGTQIPVYKPGDVEYEVSVDVANLLYRFSRPKCVVKPEQSIHVVEVVQHAFEHSIPITVKNGGHSYAGLCTTNEGILLDLSRMNDVHLEHTANPPTITMQGGALWAHAYRQFVIEEVNGLVVNGGRCPTVGVSGFVLGGGLGPFTRKFGMGCDRLLEATLVTGKGELVKVTKGHNQDTDKEDLFWALRGAGANNFGAVLTMKMSLDRLRGTDVVTGRYTCYPPADRKEEFINAMKDFYAADWSDTMTIDTSWFCNPKEKNGDLAVRFLSYYDGDKTGFKSEIYERLEVTEDRVQLQEMKSLLGTNLERRSVAEKSSRVLHETLVAQWSEETMKALPANKVHAIYSSFVFGRGSNYDGIIDSITKRMDEFKIEFNGESALLQVTFIHTGKKASEKRADETAFPWREASHIAYIMLQWDEKWLGDQMKAFCNRFKADLKHYSIDEKAGFLNFPDRELCEIEQDRHEAYYGANSSKIREVKSKWDPKGIFRFAPENARVDSSDSDIVASLQGLTMEEQLMSSFLPFFGPFPVLAKLAAMRSAEWLG